MSDQICIFFTRLLKHVNKHVRKHVTINVHGYMFQPGETQYNSVLNFSVVATPKVYEIN